jgi:hypothetical protein
MIKLRYVIRDGEKVLQILTNSEDNCSLHWHYVPEQMHHKFIRGQYIPIEEEE